MNAKIAAVPFTGTKEQEYQLEQVVKSWRGKPGSLMPVLQEAQEIYGYLPEEVQVLISKGLDISMSEIYGVVTFYSQFNLTPKGKYKISVCMGTACYVKDSQRVFEELQRVLGVVNGGLTDDGLFSLDATRCLGCCGLAPVIMVNDDVYGRLTPQEVGPIIDKYRSVL